MVTTEQLVFAAAQAVTSAQVRFAMDIFLAAAFDTSSSLIKTSPAIANTPLNCGLIAMTMALQKIGWSQAFVVAMGIRVYRTMFAVIEGMPETTVLLTEDPVTHKSIFKDSMIDLIASTSMSYNREKGVMEVDEETFRKSLNLLVHKELQASS